MPTKTTSSTEVRICGRGAALDAVSLLQLQVRPFAVLNIGIAQLVTQHSNVIAATCDVLWRASGMPAIEIIKEFVESHVVFNIRWSDELPLGVIIDHSLSGTTLKKVLFDITSRLDAKQFESVEYLDPDDLEEIKPAKAEGIREHIPSEVSPDTSEYEDIGLFLEADDS